MTITSNSVLNALKSLQYRASVSTSTKFLESMLVKYGALEHGLLNTLDQRRLYLNDLLIDTLTGIFHHFCQMHHLSLPSPKDTLADVKSQIQREAMLQNAELTTASWMYYRYVRVDLDISIEDYCALAGIDERTLRRYHQHGVRRLTENLARQEGQLHQAQKQRRLLASLPAVQVPHLFGRGQLLAYLEGKLCHARPQHLQIIGVPGIGKTVLIQELTRQFIEKDLIDQLLWTDVPASTEIIQDKLIQMTAPLTVKEYLMLYRVMVVIDDSTRLPSDKLDELLQLFNAAVVVVVNRQYRRLKYVLENVAVPPIPEVDAKQYIGYINSAQYPGYEHELTEEQIHRLWQCVGGHPTRIHEAITAAWEEFQPEDMK